MNIRHPLPSVPALIPLIAGVLVLDWRFADLLVAAWTENLAVGLAAVVQLGTTAAIGDPADLPEDHGLRGASFGGVQLTATTFRWFFGFATLFFCVHFGLFTLVHGVFTFAFASGGFGAGVEAAQIGFVGVLLLAARAVLAHGVRLYTTFVRPRAWHDPVQALEAFRRPYARVVPLHVTLVLGGVVASLLSAPELALSVLLLAVFAIADHVADGRSSSRLTALFSPSPPDPETRPAG